VGQTSNQIEDHIERTRDELGANFQELEDKVRDAGNWRVQFHHHPMTMLGAAFGGGMLLAAMFTRPRHITTTAVHQVTRRSNAAWDNVKDALLGVAATKVTDYVDRVIPGFASEYRSRTHSGI
jgi:hypothetical protein